MANQPTYDEDDLAGIEPELVGDDVIAESSLGPEPEADSTIAPLRRRDAAGGRGGVEPATPVGSIEAGFDRALRQAVQERAGIFFRTRVRSPLGRTLALLLENRKTLSQALRFLERSFVHFSERLAAHRLTESGMANNSIEVPADTALRRALEELPHRERRISERQAERLYGLLSAQLALPGQGIKIGIAPKRVPQSARPTAVDPMDFEDQVGGFLEADRSSEDALTRASPEVSRALRRAARYLLDVERRLSDAAEGTGG